MKSRRNAAGGLVLALTMTGWPGAVCADELPLARSRTILAQGLAAASQAGAAASPAPVHSDWSRVRALTPGTRIALTARNMTTREVKVVGADDDSVTIAEARSDQTYQKADIVEISYPEAHYGRQGAWLGALVGAGIAAIWVATRPAGGWSCSNEDGCLQYLIVGFWAGIGAGAGAGVGAVASAKSHQHEVIYKAPVVRSTSAPSVPKRFTRPA